MKGWKGYTPYLKCARCGCLRPPTAVRVSVPGSADVVCKDVESCNRARKTLKEKPR